MIEELFRIKLSCTILYFGVNLVANFRVNFRQFLIVL